MKLFGKDFEDLALDIFFVFGLVLFVALKADDYFSCLPKIDESLKNLAYSATMLTQVIRGLLPHINDKLPKWLTLTSLDKRTFVNTVFVFLGWWLFCEIYLHNFPDHLLVSRLAQAFLVAEIVLGILLFALWGNKLGLGSKKAALVLVVATLVLLAPLWLVADIGFSMYRFGHFDDEKDVSLLIASSLIPLYISVIYLNLNDQRNRLQNTKMVIKSQLFALPLYPLSFLALRNWWPQNVSIQAFPIILTAILGVFLLCVRQKKPWLVKEKVEVLHANIAIQELQQKLKRNNLNQNEPLSGDTFDQKLAECHRDFAEDRLTLKNELDHLDRADGLKLLAELEIKLGKHTQAEKTFDEAINAYNKALELNQQCQQAIKGKFNAVEAKRQLPRREDS